jgi:hypothetical protein
MITYKTNYNLNNLLTKLTGHIITYHLFKLII